MDTVAVNTMLPVKANVQPVSRTDRDGTRLMQDHGSRSDKRLKFLGYGRDGVNNRYGSSGRMLGERIGAGRIIDLYI